MDTDSFWHLIDECRQHGLSSDKRDAWLHEALLRLPPAEIVRFQACLEHLTAEAFTWDLWAAADRVFGGWCSDDTFCYFQHWLIGLGRPAFEAAVADPDALAYAPEVLRLSALPRTAWSKDEAPQWENLGDLALRAYAHRTGESDDCGEAFCRAAETLLAPRRAHATTPSGRRWSVRDEEESTRRLPRLTVMFPLAEAH